MAKKVDLSKLSLKELKALSKDIEKAITVSVENARAAAMADVEKAAEKHGFSLKELIGTRKSAKSKKSPQPAKYRHPDNPSLTWSGRGRQPAWYKEAMAKGIKPESLEV